MNWKRIVWIKSQKADSLWRSSSTSLHPFCLLLPWKYPLPYLDESSIAAGVICGACACIYLNGYVHAWVHLYMCVCLCLCVIVRKCVLYVEVFCHIDSAVSYIQHRYMKGLLIMVMAFSEPKQLILAHWPLMSHNSVVLSHFVIFRHLCHS